MKWPEQSVLQLFIINSTMQMLLSLAYLNKILGNSRLQNSVVRVVIGRPCCFLDHIPSSKLIYYLYWLPTEQCIQFNLAVITYNILHLHCLPTSISWFTHPNSPVCCSHRSSDLLRFTRPSSAIVIGCRPFRSAAYASCIRQTTSLHAFKNVLILMTFLV